MKDFTKYKDKACGFVYCVQGTHMNIEYMHVVCYVLHITDFSTSIASIYVLNNNIA